MKGITAAIALKNGINPNKAHQYPRYAMEKVQLEGPLHYTCRQPWNSDGYGKSAHLF